MRIKTREHDSLLAPLCCGPSAPPPPWVSCWPPPLPPAARQAPPPPGPAPAPARRPRRGRRLAASSHTRSRVSSLSKRPEEESGVSQPEAEDHFYSTSARGMSRELGTHPLAALEIPYDLQECCRCAWAGLAPSPPIQLLHPCPLPGHDPL